MMNSFEQEVAEIAATLNFESREAFLGELREWRVNYVRLSGLQRRLKNQRRTRRFERKLALTQEEFDWVLEFTRERGVLAEPGDGLWSRLVESMRIRLRRECAWRVATRRIRRERVAS